MKKRGKCVEQKEIALTLLSNPTALMSVVLGWLVLTDELDPVFGRDPR